MEKTIEKANAMLDHLSAIDKILEEHDYQASHLIPILQRAQEVYSYLSKDMISYIATSLKIPPAQVYGVATFYAHFSLEPKGKYVFKLCDGTACHVKKSHGILNALYDKLGLSHDKHTTDDLLFTVETVSCLGACGLAPVLLANDEVHGEVTPAEAVALVDRFIEEEAELAK